MNLDVLNIDQCNTPAQILTKCDNQTKHPFYLLKIGNFSKSMRQETQKGEERSFGVNEDDLIYTSWNNLKIESTDLDFVDCRFRGLLTRFFIMLHVINDKCFDQRSSQWRSQVCQ